MKIFISHIPNTYNYGSAMMAVNVIHYLNEELGGDVEFYTDCSSQEDLERLKKSTNLKNIRINEIEIKLGKKNSGGKVKKLLSIPSRLNDYDNRLNDYVNKISKAYDGVIILGGDDLSEYYSKRNIVFELNRIRKLNGKTKIFLIGQTIGPFTSFRKLLAKVSLKGSYIYTRDYKTYNFVNDNYKPREVKASADLAFLDLPNQHNLHKNYLEKLGLEENKYLTLVPSGLVNSYVNNEQRYIEEWVKIIEDLSIKEDLKEKKFAMLAHVLKPAKSDDRIIISKIYDKLSKDLKDKVIKIDYPILPEEAREILRGGLFTITGRMHSAVSTFQIKKPALSLSYSIKYAGVIGEILGMDKLIIESVGDDKWESGYIRSAVNEKVDFILSDYDKLVKDIDLAVEKAKVLVEDQIKDISIQLMDT